jgi:hypothetical protein
MWEYKGIKFDDAIVDDLGACSQMCPECIKKYGIPKGLLEDHGSGICGVEGCWNNYDEDEGIETFYINFPKGELIELA